MGQGHIFCFICFTGVRYSLVKNICKQEADQGVLYYSLSGKKLALPLNSYALEIINKYKHIFFRQNTIFPVYSEITVNKYLKQVFGQFGLIRMIEFKTSGRNISLHECITIKTAWNTFLINGLSLGVSEETLKRFAGSGSGPVLKRFSEQLFLKDQAEISRFNSL